MTPQRDWLYVSSDAAYQSKVSKHQIRHVLLHEAGVKMPDFCGASRNNGIVMVRFAFYAMARRLTGSSYPSIGRAVNRDHTTVQAAFKSKTMARPEVIALITATTEVLKKQGLLS